MEEFNSEIQEFKSNWDLAYETALNNPSARDQYASESTLSSINESVSVVINWLERLRAPAGFSPGFHVAKSVCALYLPQLISSSKNIASAQFNHFGSFSAYLTNILNAIHTMAIFQAKDGNTDNEDLSAELIQSIELLNTAQKELSEKLILLTDASVKFEEIEMYHTKIEERKLETESILESIDQSIKIINQKKSTLEQAFSDIQSQKSLFEKTIESHESEYVEDKAARSVQINDLINTFSEQNAELKLQNESLESQVEEKTNQLNQLINQAEQQNKIIDSILPKAASAGLAAAFSKRVDQLEITKWMWFAIFLLSLLGMFWFAHDISTQEISNMDQFVSRILYKLPLLTPIIWMAWFSAIQYGNNIRVQEDYAFKEATSKAFQGYKDHMEHLGNIDINEAETAITLLSASTIRILGTEPLRIYGKAHSDASPANNFSELLKNVVSRNDDK